MKIALLIDVDNYKVNASELNYLVNRLNMKGEVVYGKVYNYSDRNNKDLSETIEQFGFDTAMQTTNNKRTKKSIFDLRIAIDAVKICCTNKSIDAFCLACGDGDIIPLISMLRAEGKTVLGCFNPGSEANERVCNEVILLNRVSVQANKVVAQKVAKTTKLIKNIEKKTSTKTTIKPARTVEPAKVVSNSTRREALVSPQSPERWERVERQLDEVERNRPSWMDEVEDEEKVQESNNNKTILTQTISRERRVEPVREEKTYEEPEEDEEDLPNILEQENNVVEEINSNEEENDDAMPQHRFNAQSLAAKLESFARRTAALNFDSGEDIEEKKQLLAEIDECLDDEEFQGENLTPDEEEAFNEIKSLVESLKDTIQKSID